jgi:glycogen debranching enzyme
MFMSKLWMYNIWSWDNCFNALGLAKDHPHLAYEQLEIFMDHQDESGAYPDFINDKFKSYNCVKPPIFPYFYLKYMEKNPFFRERENLEKAYDSMARNLAYYEKYRTYEGRIPHYRHGNDSGWDNASLFHAGMPAEAPDLAAHLIRSYDAMKDMAGILGMEADVGIYREKADALQRILLELYHDEEGFFGRVGREGKKNPIRTSLILCLPLIIGYRLDKQVVEKLVKNLEAFEADYGLATESLVSERYKANGYWLGPIWAPVSFLIIDSLYELGYTDQADRLRRKYLELTLVGGMAENFDPYTGEGLVDTSFTWTSSVFLELLKRKAGI